MTWYDLKENPDGTFSKHLNPIKPQQDILKSKAQYVALIAGTGVGKSVCGSIFLLTEVSKNPTGKFIAIAPTFKILDSVTLQTWKETVANTPFEGQWKEAKKEYLLPQGGTIYFRSAENPDSFQGIHVSGCVWMDEAGMMPINAWHVVQQRVRFNRARVFIGTTPYSNHQWLKHEVLDRFKGGDPAYYVRTAHSIENPHYPQDQFEQAKRELPEWKFRMMYQGEFTGASGLVYPEMCKCFVDMPDTLPSGLAYAGMDWGGGTATSDPFAVLIGILDDDDCLWIVKERYLSNTDILENSQWLKDVDKQFKNALGSNIQKFWADASRPDSIRVLKRTTGLNVKKAPNKAGSIAFGIDLVNSRIRTGRLKIIKEAVKGLLRESELYSYPLNETEEPFGDTPVDRHNHAMDALRYLVLGVDRKASTITT